MCSSCSDGYTINSDETACTRKCIYTSFHHFSARVKYVPTPTSESVQMSLRFCQDRYRVPRNWCLLVQWLWKRLHIEQCRHRLFWFVHPRIRPSFLLKYTIQMCAQHDQKTTARVATVSARPVAIVLLPVSPCAKAKAVSKASRWTRTAQLAYVRAFVHLLTSQLQTQILIIMQNWWMTCIRTARFHLSRSTPAPKCTLELSRVHYCSCRSKAW